MKKLFFIILFNLPFMAQAEVKTACSSKTFLFQKPSHNSLPVDITWWKDSLFTTEHPYALKVTLSQQKSFKEKDFKHYFLPAYHDSVVVSNTDANASVRPQWLGLANDFTGTLSLEPTYEALVWSTTLKRSLKGLFNLEFFDRWWAFVTIPFVITETDMHFRQSNVTGQGAATNPVHDIISAFNNKEWGYQKIAATAESAIKIPTLFFGAGSTFLLNSRALVAYYSAVSLPLAKRQNNEFLFAPQPGFNGHLSLLWSVHMQLPLLRETAPYNLSVFIDLENNFLVRNHQYRTFDLKDKEWSRYLLLRKKDQVTNSTTPAMNILTRKVRASSYNIIEASTGLRFNKDTIHAEIGFGVWGHKKERLKFIEAWQENYGIAGDDTNRSASASTIKTQADNDDVFIPIKESDLNIESGTSPAQAIYRGHIAFGWEGIHTLGNSFFGCGCSIEMPRNKTKALPLWGLWSSIGITF